MKKKILLIDDSKTQLGTMRILLVRAGYEVETAEDGVSGYKKLFEFAPDIVVSDILMPNLNGYQLCRLIKDNPLTSKIPVILLTILEQKMDKFWGKKSGADSFLLKTTDFEEIVDKINSLMLRRPVSDEVKELILKHSYEQDEIQVELNKILDSTLMQSTLMNEFRVLSKHIENEAVLSRNLFELLNSLINYDMAVFIMKIPSLQEEVEVYADKCIKISDDLFTGLVKAGIKKGFPDSGNMDFYIKNVYESRMKDSPFNDDELKSSYVHTIRDNTDVLGAICFFGLKEFDMANHDFFDVVFKEIDLLLKIKSLYNKTKFLSITDSLTGLYNREYMMQNLEREYSRSSRYGSYISVAMVDLDFFKSVNDTHGHQTGDIVLKEITHKIYSSLRKTDIIFRYGGEEILIIMPETEKKSAFIPLERIRENISSSPIKYGDKIINATISIGIADNQTKVESAEKLIEIADKALYKAKQTGRNKVVIYDE